MHMHMYKIKWKSERTERKRKVSEEKYESRLMSSFMSQRFDSNVWAFTCDTLIKTIMFLHWKAFTRCSGAFKVPLQPPAKRDEVFILSHVLLSWHAVAAPLGCVFQPITDTDQSSYLGDSSSAQQRCRANSTTLYASFLPSWSSCGRD